MKLFYLTSSDLKSMPANAVHTTNMVKAFLKNGCSVKYFVKKSSQHYPNGFMWSSLLVLINILIFKILNFKENVVIHSRDRNKLAIILAFLGFKVGIEFHNLKKLNSFESFVLRVLTKIGVLKLFFTSKTLYNHFISTNFQGLSLPYTKLENGVSEYFIKQELQKPILNQNLSFAMVSSKRIGKGQEKMNQLSQSYPDYKFTIVGPSLPNIENTNNLNLVGKINNQDVFTYLKDADVLLALIDKKMEVAGGRFEDGDLACPLKIFEYLALAKPIIMSKRIAMLELFSFLPGVWFVQDDLSDFDFVINEIKKLDQIKLENIQITHKKFINKLSWENRAKSVLSVLN
jgi:glycosyltransferase involved in cell wall biosynthesis